MPPPPNQKPTLLTSWEYASRVIGSAPGFSGALRPENRVTARSKLPQKKCTGLDFPMNCDRKRCRTASTESKMRQNFCTDAASYERCNWSLSKGIGSGISTGIVQML